MIFSTTGPSKHSFIHRRLVPPGASVERVSFREPDPLVPAHNDSLILRLCVQTANSFLEFPYAIVVDHALLGWEPPFGVKVRSYLHNVGAWKFCILEHGIVQ